ncbi:hypothetical protein [Cupriavidus gilardii]|uniref:hypothetical protein n=1 Tax=Cupriavidus gilardii TaxID=82541 RepID=UPI0021B284EC|nr:hypothetical protein [Cupriavidus gilardii]UXC38273.1 hypothetical protein N4G38_24745 [Cupriavidus gilardii]
MDVKIKKVTDSPIDLSANFAEETLEFVSPVISAVNRVVEQGLAETYVSFPYVWGRWGCDGAGGAVARDPLTMHFCFQAVPDCPGMEGEYRFEVSLRDLVRDEMSFPTDPDALLEIGDAMRALADEISRWGETGEVIR